MRSQVETLFIEAPKNKNQVRTFNNDNDLYTVCIAEVIELPFPPEKICEIMKV